MSGTKKTLSSRDYNEAKALYMLASFKYAEAREYERKLAEIMGASDDRDYNDFAEEGIYSRDAGKAVPFDTVLKNAGIKFQPFKIKRQS